MSCRLVEVGIFIQIEVTDHCSDVRKLFSGIGNECGKHYVQKQIRSVHKMAAIHSIDILVFVTAVRGNENFLTP